MSKTLSTSENTSPTPSVRLSVNPQPLQHDLLSSPSEPEEITPPTCTLHSNHTNTTAVDEWRDDGPVRISISQHLPPDGHFLDSAAATPRLPPSKHGSDDLQVMPTHELGMLDDSTAPSTSPLPQSLSSGNPRPSPSSISSKGPLVTSFSEVNLHTTNSFRSILQHGLHSGDKGPIKDNIAAPSRPDRRPALHSLSPSLHPARTKSQGAVPDAQISRMLEEDIKPQDPVSEDRERPAQQAEGTTSVVKRNRSSSRSGRVEKRIEATLARAEPSSTARSRKSSHLLGLFKENATKPVERVSTPLVSDLKEGEDPSKGVLDEDRTAKPTPQADVRSYGGPVSIPQVGGQADQQRAAQPVGRQSSPEHDDHAERGSHQHRSSDLRREIPPDLLSEIRDHKLAIPTGSKDGLRALQDPTRAAPSGPKGSSDVQLAEPEQIIGGEGEEDSDKEEISSALYYPHEAPSPGTPEDLPDTRSASDDRFPQKEAENPVEAPAAAEDGPDTPSDEVDIALQSQNKQRYLHGDLPKAVGASEDALASVSGFSSASGSDYESQDESGRSVSGDEGAITADSETTPKASPGAGPSFLRSRSRKKLVRPAAPFGAVELKPYTHQVGGHSTVYKFSKRAVCKPLSNRENEFYEVIEHQHPELLKFMPRYGTFSLDSSYSCVTRQAKI